VHRAKAIKVDEGEVGFPALVDDPVLADDPSPETWLMRAEKVSRHPILSTRRYGAEHMDESKASPDQGGRYCADS
jgi:hypothetical protein